MWRGELTPEKYLCLNIFEIMRAYNVSIIENKRRVQALKEFDKLLEDYLFSDLDDRINAKLCNKWPEIYEFLSPNNRLNFPPQKLYPLYKFNLLDCQQIGIALGCEIDAYKKNALIAWFNTFNPIWWVLKLIGFLLRLFAKFLWLIGFNNIQARQFSKWVESDCARIIIFLLTIASGIAAFIYIILLFL